jgi:hypothetical protein
MGDMSDERTGELLSAQFDMSDSTTDELLDASDLHRESQRARVEKVLATLPGVITARLVPGLERSIDELHVIASTGKPPKTIVRDVTSMLFARFGLSIDHRVVSVVQIDERTSPLGGKPRPAIERVVATQEGLTTRLTVDLALVGDDFTGDAEGPSSVVGRRRATARATLAAVRPLLAQDAVVEVEGVDVVPVAGRSVAIALVHFHMPRGERTVAGSAMVLSDENVAIARAVLDAVNRSIERAGAESES